MAVIIIALTTLGFGWLFLREGLLQGAMMLVSVFLGAAAALGFGPGLAGVMGVESPLRYAVTIILLGVVCCGLARALLLPLNQDLDFHPLVERLGGAVTGALCGILVGGFLCAWLLCLQWSALSRADAGLRRGAGMVLGPCAAVAWLTPGRYPFEIQTLIDHTPPEPTMQEEQPEVPPEG